MATAAVVADVYLVTSILRHLSDMKYKDRRQQGPDQPVELLEFRPTLVPSILVNRLWADEGTSILWRRYPHLPALTSMDPARRQYYANKVQRIFSLLPPNGNTEIFDHLDGLHWPSLRTLELEGDFVRHSAKFLPMLHDGLEHWELSGIQSGAAPYFSDVVLPALFSPCRNLKSCKFGPIVFSNGDQLHATALFDHLDSTPSIKTVEVKSAGFIEMDSLFTRLSQRPNLEGLEIDVEPGLALLPQLEGPGASPSLFSSLKRLHVMCYPEIANNLPQHFSLIEELEVVMCRIPNQSHRDSDYYVLGDFISRLSHCPHLQVLNLGIGLLSVASYAPPYFPTLSGMSLISLAKSCPRLKDINLYAVGDSAINASRILSEDFDTFCGLLPSLETLDLNLDPSTASNLLETILQSCGKHCQRLRVLRLTLPLHVPSLPVSCLIPQIMVSAPGTPVDESVEVAPQSPNESLTRRGSNLSGRTAHSTSTDPVAALFPCLTHLALARPNTVLIDNADSSFSSFSWLDPGDLDPELDLVRSWGHALITHFPHLEILEAWGDWTGHSYESFRYFLPTEEILATTWEFLSGVEQNLWEDDEEGYENGHGQSSAADDWHAASYLNEYTGSEDFYVDIDGNLTSPGHRFLEDESCQHIDNIDSQPFPYEFNRMNIS